MDNNDGTDDDINDTVCLREQMNTHSLVCGERLFSLFNNIMWSHDVTFKTKDVRRTSKSDARRIRRMR